MSREMKFRVWSNHTKKMFDDGFYISQNGDLFQNDSLDYKSKDSFEVMRYTGFKDSKGNEIYEGDIVKISDHPFQGSIDINGNYEVYYNEYTELSCGGWYLFRMKHYAEVIGNKFENPELLKGADEE
ncbi:YopX family protein [Lysinibacillus capsici]|uniref:YopX family protein n=1 Tax=Lysinibacillus capsici TaxID=2115968 RepID=UPI0034E2F6B6